MSSFSEYPFIGSFYRLSSDKTKSPILRQGEPTKQLLATVECDVQEDKGGSIEVKGTLVYYFIVYFDNISTTISEGDYFESTTYGKKVNGVVRYVIVNELGTKVKVEDTTT